MELILQEFPSFAERWQNHLEYWEGETAGLCNDIAQFSRYVIDFIATGDQEELPAVFDFMEQLLVDGDQQVQEAVATCFLENLINQTGTTLDPKTFVHLLGPQSRIYCQGWDEFTGVYTEGLWQRRDVLGGSPLPQGDDLLTLEEYKVLVKERHDVHQEYYSLSYQKPEHRARKDFLDKRLKELNSTYLSRLPNYLLARCPICGGQVTEKIDTFSLNGMGWPHQKYGVGWYGLVRTHDMRRADHLGQAPHYKTECDHVRVIAVGVNLNCKRPDDVFERVGIGSERPFVMAPLIKIENSFAVMHTLPIGRFDDSELRHHYTAHFTTYFTIDEATFDSVMQPAYETMSLVIYTIADYDLPKWVEKGKLFWLDKNDPDLPLRNKPVSDFPYSDLKGYEGQCVIFKGRLKCKSRNPGHNPCKESGSEKGLLHRLVKGIRGE